MRKGIAIAAGLMSIAAGMITFIMGLVSSASTASLFGYQGILNTFMFGFFVGFSIVGGLGLLAPKWAARVGLLRIFRRRPEPTTISDTSTTLKTYRTSGIYCMVGGILAFLGVGYVDVALVVVIAGIVGLVLGLSPTRR